MDFFFSPAILFSAFWISPAFVSSQCCFFTLYTIRMNDAPNRTEGVKTPPYHAPPLCLCLIQGREQYDPVQQSRADGAGDPRHGQQLLQPQGWWHCSSHHPFSIQSIHLQSHGCAFLPNTSPHASLQLWSPILHPGMRWKKKPPSPAKSTPPWRGCLK